eukprot:4930068-Amphidinium_carterae.1
MAHSEAQFWKHCQNALCDAVVGNALQEAMPETLTETEGPNFQRTRQTMTTNPTYNEGILSGAKFVGACLKRTF